MTKYRVMGMNPRASAGVGPMIIEAESIEEAEEKFAEREWTTIEAMRNGGLVVIAVEVE